MCDNPLPDADGLKGAKEPAGTRRGQHINVLTLVQPKNETTVYAPYGFGIPMSSGMYALGLGSAVVRVICAGAKASVGAACCCACCTSTSRL